ncbi:tyrosine-type recombinase/integrase [Halomontanus rarus]|uniref:tyrosine-type recombinase/integrase n=1 Tax=Halomontanus rarus TaxID=3034020 RepID=UPI00293B9572|nr:tyrosine-type recombinase/integrase [Halovivax sp. KZCA124]
MDHTQNRSTPKGRAFETIRSDYLRTLSDTSAKNMRPVLERFETYLTRNGTDVVESIDVYDCRRYASRLADDEETGDIAASTAHTYFDYVAGFLGYCVREGLLDTNPARKNQATENLPEDRGERERQFWDPADRQQLFQFVDRRVDSALEPPRVPSQILERRMRDRAIVYVLGKTGVRGAEVFAVSGDETRNGLRWADVNLEDGVLRVLGKSRNIEAAPLPSRPQEALSRWYDVLEPPTDEWPVFPSDHAPSKYTRFREGLEGDHPESTIETLLSNNDVDELLREYEVPPPSISTAGARRVMQRLCEDARIGLEEDEEYLKPHGARRALGDELYRENPTTAQTALRHKSIETTKAAYSDIETGELNDAIDALEN